MEQTLLSNKKWGSRDRRFIAESIYEIVRWYRLLYEINGKKPESDNDWWQLFGMLQIINGRTLPEWKEFEGLDEKAILDRRLKLEKTRSIAASIPEWLDQQGEMELGKQLWTETIHALNENAQLVLRANRLKTDIKTLLATLKKEGVEGEAIGGEAIVLNKRRKLSGLKSFRKGFFEVQDFGSQQIALFLEAAPGMTVIDACAGAGGKTLHLAALMGNKGNIKALDIHQKKLRELEKRARRNGVKIIQSQKINENGIKKLYETADRLLLDVPCTGLGILKRKPDAKWKLSLEILENVRTLQADILNRYSKMLKTGGKMVYATCSVLPSENEEQILNFLEGNSDKFILLKEKTIRPQEGYDGFYMALLERIN